MAGKAGGGCLGPLILFMGGAMASNAIFGGFPKGFFDAVIHLGSLGSPVEAGETEHGAALRRCLPNRLGKVEVDPLAGLAVLASLGAWGRGKAIANAAEPGAHRLSRRVESQPSEEAVCPRMSTPKGATPGIGARTAITTRPTLPPTKRTPQACDQRAGSFATRARGRSRTGTADSNRPGKHIGQEPQGGGQGAAPLSCLPNPPRPYGVSVARHLRQSRPAPRA